MSSARAARVPAALTELNWTIAEVCIVLLWKLRPLGLKLRKRELAALPIERVLVEERLTDRIIYRWVKPDEVVRENALRAVQGKPKPGLYEAQGRYMKLLGVLLWKLAKDGITLGISDRDAVPANRVLVMHGSRDTVEYQFVSRSEANRMAKRAEDDGREIVEAIRR